MTDRSTEAPDDGIIAAAVPALIGTSNVVTPSPAVAAALTAQGVPAEARDLPPAGAGVPIIALLADELSAAGEHAEGLLHDAVEALAPGGTLVVTATGILSPGQGMRPFQADDLRRALGHVGVDVEVLCAPGAAARVRGDAAPQYDPELDRVTGLLDAGHRLLAVGTTARSPAARSHTFFSTLPFKVVAAAVICRDGDGRLLLVHDSFKNAWTIPGGVVDADEDPKTAAVREAWEEAGMRVEAGAILGVFSASWPDRLVLIYEGTVIGDEHRHGPLHAHEIDAVEWVAVDEALGRLIPYVAVQVRRCLADPGGTWRQGLG